MKAVEDRLNKPATISLEHILTSYKTLAEEYLGKWSLKCILVDKHGKIVYPESGFQSNPEKEHLRKRALEESLRWGEPSLLLNQSGEVVWAVPVMFNLLVLGGLAVEDIKVSSETENRSEHSPQEIRLAAQDLLAMANQLNLTNSALMESNRLKAMRESQRAEAIHELKGLNYWSIRDLYLTQEPELISAIKKGDRPKAREILNRVLVAIYHLGSKRPKLLKSFILELVVTMSRSAVEAGGDPSVLLGANYSCVAELASIDSEEQLCAWLVSMLERMLDAIGSNKEYPNSVLLGAALNYMQEHLMEEISRDDVAEIACLSPSHFSRVVKHTLGYSFTELLAQMRVDRAKEMLVSTDRSLLQVSLDCGFSDQSYFTKVFQKHTGSTPGDFRKSRKPGNKL